MLRKSLPSPSDDGDTALQDLVNHPVTDDDHETLRDSSSRNNSQSLLPPLNSSTSHASSEYFPRDYRWPSGNSRASRASRASRSSQASLTPAQVHALVTARRNSRTSRKISIPERPEEESPSEAPQDPLGRLLDLDDQPVPTTKCTQEFQKVAMRMISTELRREKDVTLQASKKKKVQHEQTLQALRAWVAAKEKTLGVKGFLKKFLRLDHVPRLPHLAEIVDMAKYYYPPRGDVKVYICDFGKDRFSKQEVPLGRVDIELHSKPEWSIVRWIHAPLNVGLVHASLEDRFLAVDRENATERGVDISWPYAQLETISMRKRSDLADMQDVKKFLTQHKELLPVTEELNRTAMDGIEAELADDLTWRAGHFGVAATFWELVASDAQRQLSSGSSIDEYYVSEKLNLRQLDKQTLSNVTFYNTAQIVRFPFRCFHRSDGFLLTMAGGPGLDFLDAKLKEHLSRPADTFYDNDDSSVIGLMFELFAKTGTSTWHRNNVDWFLIYLLTEVAAAPHHLRQGGNAPHLCKAYQSVVQELKDRRYERFNREKSISLVREFLSCIDELTNINAIYARKLHMLEQLKKQVSHSEAEEGHIPPDNPIGETANSRIDWAVARVTADLKLNKELLNDLQLSLTALFQLRSIEQNELAIVADTQNRAVLVFTGVTTIFLPLTFVTGYYGMNIKSIANTSKSEGYFWKLSITVSIIIVLLVTLLAFQHRLRTQLRRFLMNQYTV